MHADVTLSVAVESVTLSEGCNPSFAALLYTRNCHPWPTPYWTVYMLVFYVFNIVKSDCLVNPYSSSSVGK